jgi:DNA-directed RNA polymerase beta' subunit
MNGLSHKQTELMVGEVVVYGEGDVIADDDGNIIIPTDKNVIIDKRTHSRMYCSSKRDVSIKDGLFQNMYLVKTADVEIILQPSCRVFRGGEQIDIKCNVRKQILLNIGDVVDRHLHDGDWVLFNRQPTLHRGSMLGMEVVVHKSDAKTFRFAPATTKIFNADFDGDEMNIHAPQSYEAIAELKEICNAKHHIMSISDSKPIIGPVQDMLIGLFLMTSRKTEDEIQIDNGGETTDSIHSMNMRRRYFDLAMLGKNLYSSEKMKKIEYVFNKFNQKKHIHGGHSIFSLLLPDGFYFEKTNNLSKTEPSVKIYDGVCYEGVLDKSTVGCTNNSILHALCNQYSPDVSSTFINNVQYVSNAYSIYVGFSIGLEDCLIDSIDSTNLIQNEIDRCCENAKGVEETTYDPVIRESLVISKLSEAMNIGSVIAKKSMKPTNNFLVCVNSGAKGEIFNTTQLTGALGQQYVNGKRIKSSLNHSTRILPHYPIGGTDKNLEYQAMGFIRSSFIQGLTPLESFAHDMGGRTGIVDSAVETATTGYIQRRLVKILENDQLHMDSTVRNPHLQIIQLSYGEIGNDPMAMVKVNGNSRDCSISNLVDKLNAEFEMSEELNEEVEEVEEVEEEFIDFE